MRVLLFVLTCALSFESPAQGLGMNDPLMDTMPGTWVMTGTIAGDQITHDLTIRWILERQYLRIHEVSRELDSLGKPAYEADVTIGWNPDRQQYACMWLDITGGNGLVGRGIGHATKDGDSLPFVFDAGDGSLIYNTFTYDRAADAWRWAIDSKSGDDVSPFARVELRRQENR